MYYPYYGQNNPNIPLALNNTSYLLDNLYKVQIGEKSFTIDGRGICHNWEGWRYLFKEYGRTPNGSYTDKDLSDFFEFDEVFKYSTAARTEINYFFVLISFARS